MLDQPLSQRLREIREAQPARANPLLAPEVPRRVPLGELLVEKGLLSELDLGIALAHQRVDGRPLGQILLGMGVLTEQDLARTLTEQHGFDFSASLRRRLSGPGERLDADPAEAEMPQEAAAPERYILRTPGHDDPLHVADSFLDAADAAFELIEDDDPDQLEIVRSRDGSLEHLWSYRRETCGSPPDHPSLS